MRPLLIGWQDTLLIFNSRETEWIYLVPLASRHESHQQEVTVSDCFLNQCWGGTSENHAQSSIDHDQWCLICSELHCTVSVALLVSGWGSWSQHSPGCLIRCIYFSCGREGARRVVSEIVYSALILQANSHSTRAPLIPALIPWVLFHNSHDETAPDAAALVSAAADWFFFIHVIPNRNDRLKRFQ